MRLYYFLFFISFSLSAVISSPEEIAAYLLQIVWEDTVEPNAYVTKRYRKLEIEMYTLWRESHKHSQPVAWFASRYVRKLYPTVWIRAHSAKHNKVKVRYQQRKDEGKRVYVAHGDLIARSQSSALDPFTLLLIDAGFPLVGESGVISNGN